MWVYSKSSLVGTKVAVVGAGVVGLSTTYCLKVKERTKVEVTVIADNFSPNTTSDKVGALIRPLDLGSSGRGSTEYDVQWTLDTFKFFYSLYHTEAAAEIELSLVSGYELVSCAAEHPWWKDLVMGFHCISMDSPEAQIFQSSQSHRNLSVWAYFSYLVDCRHYLPWLMAEFVRKGGMAQLRRLNCLDELRGYDIVVNCTGLGAAELVGDDNLHPVRGQAVLVRAPWIKHFVVDVDVNRKEWAYVFPHSGDVLLGGTAVSGNWSETVDPATSEAIVSRCAALLPSLRGAEVIDAWAGGRPVRKTMRLEKEERGSGQPLLIHNYGHGGQGIILHRGCALEVARIVEQFLK